MGMSQACKNERAKNCFQNRALSHRRALLLRNLTGSAQNRVPGSSQPHRLMRGVYKETQSRPEEEQAEIEQGGSYSCIVLAVPQVKVKRELTG